MFNDDNGYRLALAQDYKRGANWFYWIAALSLISSILVFAGARWGFLLSLGLTEAINGIAIELSEELGGATKIIAFVLDIFVTGFCAGIGWLAGRRRLWAFAIGMVLFLCDGLLSLLFTDWIGVVVHAFVLFFMFRGFQAGRELNALERTAEQNPVRPVDAPAPAATI